MQRHKAAFMCAGLYLLFGSNIFQKMCPLPDTGFICDRGISKFKKKKKKLTILVFTVQRKAIN